ncbi:hypothetical protein V3851_02210 [Paenibacillus sp. M1]|uniref:Acetyl-CoA acetyltransferase n=1 Tax=Paenibacillus haidiansis TaxID=1574488 RepID=A0ABU7VLH7_9BACL
MSLQYNGYPQQVLYQADNNLIQNLTSVRNHMHEICKRHMNHWIQVKTMDGQVITGRIMNFDKGLLYLAVPNQGANRAFFGGPSYNDVILPLVLYELLVITLLYT